MSITLRTLACAVAAVCISLAMAAPADAKAKARGAKLKSAPVSTYANGQNAAQREKSEDARLRRECKGRPNAGACLGYTR
jgi:hypothetical protein